MVEKELGIARAQTSSLKTGVQETQDTLGVLEDQVAALREKVNVTVTNNA